MQEKHVVTVFLYHEARVLLLRRSVLAGSYRGYWAGVSGYIENESPIERALIEVQEETGLGASEVTLLSAGETISVMDKGMETCWVVHPFLFGLDQPDNIHLDWENDEYRWFSPPALESLDTVPRLADALRKVLPL